MSDEFKNPAFILYCILEFTRSHTAFPSYHLSVSCKSVIDKIILKLHNLNLVLSIYQVKVSSVLKAHKTSILPGNLLSVLRRSALLSDVCSNKIPDDTIRLTQFSFLFSPIYAKYEGWVHCNFNGNLRSKESYYI